MPDYYQGGYWLLDLVTVCPQLQPSRATGAMRSVQPSLTCPATDRPGHECSPSVEGLAEAQLGYRSSVGKV